MGKRSVESKLQLRIEKTACWKHKKLYTQNQNISWQGIANAFRIQAAANARTARETEQIGKYIDYFIRSLTTPGLKQKAHQALIEDLK